MKLCTPPSVPKSWLPSTVVLSQLGMGNDKPLPATTPSRNQPFGLTVRRPPLLNGELKVLKSFQSWDRKVKASATTEAATLGSVKPLPAPLALKSPWTYAGFSVAIVSPQESPPGQ